MLGENRIGERGYSSWTRWPEASTQGFRSGFASAAPTTAASSVADDIIVPVPGCEGGTPDPETSAS